MLLNKPKGGGSVGRDELGFRVDKFSRGEWGTLLKEATDKKSGPRRGETSQDVATEQQRRGKAAQSRVEQGQVSRARQELTGATLAPKTGDTLRELQERRPRERVREIPAEILNYVAEQPLVLDGTLFSKCLASAPTGSAPGPGGCTNEMLRSFGRCGGDAVLVSCRARHGQGRHPRFGQMSHGVDHDSFAEKGWRRARNCHRNFILEVDRENVGPTVREGG